MITKNRLKELIIQNATIYGNGFGKIELISDNDISIYENGNNGYILYVLEPNKKYKNEIFDEDLFETKEDAEWHNEFGCIERTERLVLPTWEEIQKYERFDFKDKYNRSYTLHYISGFKTLAISGWSTEYYAPATKENYTIACRKAKELFLGEKE